MDCWHGLFSVLFGEICFVFDSCSVNQESPATVLEHMKTPFIKTVIERPGWCHIRYKVNGFCGDGYLSVYQSEGCSDNVWEAPYIQRPSGGRDKNEVKSDIDAEDNFVQALKDAVKAAYHLEKRTGKTIREEQPCST